MKKNKIIALLLCVFLGYLGIHRFYVGRIKSGILYFFTIGLFGVGWVYDITQIVAGKFTDVYGNLLVDLSKVANTNCNTCQSNSYHQHNQSYINITQQNTVPTQTFTPPQNMAVSPTNSTISKTEPHKDVASVSTQKAIKNFTLDEAINVYFCTDHWSCKSIYDFENYFSDAFECILKNIKQYVIQLSQEKVLRQKEVKNPISETKNITKATNVNKLKDFVAIDTETTGLKCGGNDIIEICAIKFIDFRPVEKFHTYLKPRNPIPAEATAINNITDEMVKTAPTFAQIKTSLQEFINNLPLVAHNAPFDIKFLHVSGLDLHSHIDKVYDTLHLAKLKLRDFDGSKYESYKLGELCKEQNIACTNFHSADSDTLACGILFVDIIKQVKEVNSINELLQKD